MKPVIPYTLADHCKTVLFIYRVQTNFLFLFGNITARRTIAEREIKFYFIARRIIARRAIKLLIMQLYFPLTAIKNRGGEKSNKPYSTFYKKLVFTNTPGALILAGV